MKFSIFDGTSDEDFRQRKVRLEATLRARDMIEAIANRPVEENLTKKALNTIILDLGDKPL